jgi:hypothetical protein
MGASDMRGKPSMYAYASPNRSLIRATNFLTEAWMPGSRPGMTIEQTASAAPHSPSSLAKTPFTARAQPFNLRSRVAADIAGLKRRSSRQLSANFCGSG